MPDLSSIDFSARPKGTSKREYAASILGGKKEDYTSAVKNLDDAKSFINKNQEKDAFSKGNNTEIRASIKNYNSIVEGMTGVGMGDLKTPDLPNFEQNYLNLREQYGIGTLEDSLNGLNSQLEAVKTQFYVNKNGETAKTGIAQNVVEGRVGEHEKAANERIMILDDQIQTITGQLNTAYGVIGEMMKFKSMDYDAAVKDYDTKFSAYMQTFNLVKGIDDSIKSEKERQQDIARANLQIMYNSIAANSDGWKSLSKSQQSSIAKLELQSGLPSGFYKMIESKNPGGEIITTNNWTDASGKQYSSVITRDKNGALKTQNIFLGQGKASGSGDKLTNADRHEQDISSVSDAFEQLKGGDGYISPQVWNDFRKAWTGSLNDFNDRFKQYVNPSDPYDYAGFENYKSGWKKKK